jgi:hypothetical protein
MRRRMRRGGDVGCCSRRHDAGRREGFLLVYIHIEPDNWIPLAALAGAQEKLASSADWGGGG